MCAYLVLEAFPSFFRGITIDLEGRELKIGKKRATEAAIKRYINVPKRIRRWTDPLVRGHSKRSEKGRAKVKKVLKGRKRF